MKELHDLEEQANYIWGATVDHNTWLAVVTRTGPYKGALSVSRQADDLVIHSDEVSLSFDAQFGPDVGDVAEWEMIIIEAIDRFERGALA